MYWWFRSHAEDEHLAQVGVGPDGAMYCICRQADGRQSVVHLGSAGDTLKVLAANMWEFLVLLAIGYGELGCDELAEPPSDPEGVNPSFQHWVETILGGTIL